MKMKKMIIWADSMMTIILMTKQVTGYKLRVTKKQPAPCYLEPSTITN